MYRFSPVRGVVWLCLCLILPLPFVGLTTTIQNSSMGTIGPSPPHSVRDIFFVDEQTGWILAGSNDSYFLYHTSDRGDSWEQVNFPYKGSELFFLDKNEGWAVYVTWDAKKDYPDVQPQLAHTRDGGRTWRQLSSFPPMLLNSYTQPVFTNNKTGFFPLQDPEGSAELLNTLNGGLSFEGTAITKRSQDSVISVFNNNGKGVWLFGEDLIARSQNNGNNWEVQLDRDTLPIELRCGYRFCVRLHAGWMMPDGKGWAVGLKQRGSAALILTTEDFGISWAVDVTTDESVSFNDIYFSDLMNGCTVGNSTLIYCTQNGGTTWIPIDISPALGPEMQREKKYGPLKWFEIRKIVLLATGRGWFATDGGYLFQTDDWGKSWQVIDPMKLKHNLQIGEDK